MPEAPDLSKVRLHVVTGKGGTGKTTVAAALALALTRQGKRVLLAEVEGRQGISQTFDVPPLGHTETRILQDRSGGQLWAISVDAKDSLREYLQKFYKVGKAMTVLDRFGAVDFATTIAPGVRDVLLIGKVYEAAGRRTGKGPAAPTYDAVVLDAPADRSGRAVPQRQRRGRRRRQGGPDPLAGRLDHPDAAQPHHGGARGDPARGDAGPGDRGRAGRAAPHRPTPRVRSSSTSSATRCSPTRRSRPVQPAAAPRGSPTASRPTSPPLGVKVTDGLVAGLLADAGHHADRIALEREQDAILAEEGRLTVRLPLLPEGTEGGGITVLAQAVTEQGMV